MYHRDRERTYKTSKGYVGHFHCWLSSIIIYTY